jgi:hypothetical protein
MQAVRSFDDRTRTLNNCGTGYNDAVAKRPPPGLLTADAPAWPRGWAGAATQHVAEDGPTVFAHAWQLGAEGIVSKKVDGTYSRRAARAAP